MFFYIFVALFFGVPFALLLHEYWPRSGAALFHHRHSQWHDDCRRRGLSPKQQSEEFLFRHAMTRLQRRASAAVTYSPSDPDRLIAKIAADEAETLALTDRDVAKRFLTVVDGAHLHDLLNKPAFRTVYDHGTAHHAAWEPSEDHIAAVSI